MRKKRTVVAIIVILGAVGLTAARWISDASDGPATAPVLREDFRAVVEATGRLEAAVAFEIGPPSARDFWEYNLSWMIPEGSRVKKSDVIARFDTTVLDDRLRERRADLETTLQKREKEERNLEVELKRLNLDLVKAEGELKKLDVELAVPEEFVSSIEVRQLELRRELAERRVGFLREKVEFEQEVVESKLDLLDAKKQYYQAKISYNEEVKDKFNVKAPVSGMVVYIPKQNGDRWEVGEGVWMLAKILQVADISTMRVEANVLEVDSARIAVGQPAEISIDAIPGMMISSQVTEIGRIVHERSVQDPSKVFDAMLPLGGERREGLRPGMGVRVKIETQRLADQLTVPLEAVRTSPEGTYVEVSGSGGSEKRFVELGERNRHRVVVVSGLEEGDQVILASPMSAT